jgi:hypothetical protein
VREIKASREPPTPAGGFRNAGRREPGMLAGRRSPERPSESAVNALHENAHCACARAHAKTHRTHFEAPNTLRGVERTPWRRTHSEASTICKASTSSVACSPLIGGRGGRSRTSHARTSDIYRYIECVCKHTHIYSMYTYIIGGRGGRSRTSHAMLSKAPCEGSRSPSTPRKYVYIHMYKCV